MRKSRRLGAGDGAKIKRCPASATKNALGAGECEGCGDNFPICASRFIAYDACSSLNTAGCHDFTLTLDEALRTGAIMRGMKLDEADADACDRERMAARMRDVALKSDTALVKVVQLLREERWSRLRAFL